MSRPLRPGLVAEGDSDCEFLLKVIDRQLGEFFEKSSGEAFDLFNTVRSACVKKHGNDRFYAAAARMAGECQLVFVHADHNERHEAETLASVIGNSKHPAVVLVPRRETEAWLLADPGAISWIRGANLDLLPGLCDVEKVPDPKARLKAVLAKTDARRQMDYFALAGERVDLAILAKVPAYAAWLADTEKALKELKYL